MPNGAAQSLTLTIDATEHPLLLVYVIVADPAPTAVTSPEEEMLATPVFEEAQGAVASGVPEPVNCNGVPPKVMF